MANPIIVSTWSFGTLANRAGFGLLSNPGNALDAVEKACMAVELDPKIDSVGLGGTPDAHGEVTLDACVMLDPAHSAGVACLKQCPNAVSVARRVMEHTRHKLLVGAGADIFAASQGFEKRDLVTPEARKRWETWMARDQKQREVIRQESQKANREEANQGGNKEKSHDTVGVLAIDARGIMAGACSTSGLSFKLPGRVGDSPILGDGLYVDPAAGAAVATGNGELMMGTCASFLVVERMRGGDEPAKAIEFVLKRVAAAYTLTNDEQCALIALRPDGTYACGSLRAGFKMVATTSEGEKTIESQFVLLK